MNKLDRIKLLIKHLIINDIAANQKSIGALIGYKNEASISHVLNGKKPLPKNFIEKLCKLDDKINQQWIETGEGEMLSHNRNVILSGDNNSIISTDGHHNHSIVNNINPSGNEKIINPSGEITIEPIRPGEIPVDIKIEIESLRQEIDDLKKIKYDLLRENAELRGANISLEKMNESLLNRLSKR